MSNVTRGHVAYFGEVSLGCRKGVGHSPSLSVHNLPREGHAAEPQRTRLITPVGVIKTATTTGQQREGLGSFIFNNYKKTSKCNI